MFTLPLLYSWDLSRVRLNRLLGFGFGSAVFLEIQPGSAIELFAGNHLAGSGEKGPASQIFRRTGKFVESRPWNLREDLLPKVSLA